MALLHIFINIAGFISDLNRHVMNSIYLRDICCKLSCLSVK